jgi:hypothetical protein
MGPQDVKRTLSRKFNASSQCCRARRAKIRSHPSDSDCPHALETCVETSRLHTQLTRGFDESEGESSPGKRNRSIRVSACRFYHAVRSYFALFLRDKTLDNLHVRTPTRFVVEQIPEGISGNRQKYPANRTRLLRLRRRRLCVDAEGTRGCPVSRSPETAQNSS